MRNPIAFIKNEIQETKEMYANRNRSTTDNLLWSGRVMTYGIVATMAIGTSLIIYGIIKEEN